MFVSFQIGKNTILISLFIFFHCFQSFIHFTSKKKETNKKSSFSKSSWFLSRRMALSFIIPISFPKWILSKFKGRFFSFLLLFLSFSRTNVLQFFKSKKSFNILYQMLFLSLSITFFLQKKRGKKHHSIKNTNPFLCFKKSKNIPKNEQNQTRTNQFNAPQQSQKSSDTKNNICCSQNAFQKADKCNSITKSSPSTKHHPSK